MLDDRDMMLTHSIVSRFSGKKAKKNSRVKKKIRKKYFLFLLYSPFTPFPYSTMHAFNDTDRYIQKYLLLIYKYLVLICHSHHIIYIFLFEADYQTICYIAIPPSSTSSSSSSSSSSSPPK